MPEKQVHVLCQRISEGDIKKVSAAKKGEIPCGFYVIKSADIMKWGCVMQNAVRKSADSFLLRLKKKVIGERNMTAPRKNATLHIVKPASGRCATQPCHRRQNMSSSELVRRVSATMLKDKFNEILVKPEFVEFSKGRIITLLEQYGGNLTDVRDLTEEVSRRCSFGFEMIRSAVRAHKALYADPDSKML